MKKIIFFLSSVSLSTIIITNTVACNISTNKNNKFNKQIVPQLISQQPPKDSNWKLINQKEFLNLNNKWAIIILDDSSENIWRIIKIVPEWEEKLIRLKILNNLQKNNQSKYQSYFYCWNGVGEPEMPIIDKNTSKIINWNEKK